ncbi:MAG: sporulation protein YunB [Alicyclobacillus sp.]|nr:sporulation protein YunB [Alicyclobacillus sp.]
MAYFKARPLHRGKGSGRVRPGTGRPLPGWLRGLVLLCLGTGLVCGLLAWIEWRLRPAVTASARAMAVRVATEALNAAVTEELVRDTAVEHLLVVDQADGQQPRVAHFDFAAVTQVQAAAADRAEAQLRDLSAKPFRLPVFHAVGGSLMADVGPSLPVKVYLVGSAHASVRAQVQSVGVNQTVHLLYLDLSADVQAVAPLVTEPAHVQTSTLLAYVVMNGDVPDTYVAPGAAWGSWPGNLPGGAAGSGRRGPSR